MLRWFVYSLLIFILAACSGGSQASGDNRLLDMMAYIPDTPDNRTNPIQYADYDAMYAMVGINRDDYTSEELLENFPITIIYYNDWEFSNIAPYSFRDDEAPVDLFDVTSGMSFGQPPAEGTIWVGDFSEWNAYFDDAGYEASNRNGGTVYEAEDGSRSNLADANPSRPFGGRLGQREPVAIFDDTTLVTMFNIDLLEETFTNGDKIADDENIEFITTAIYDSGTPISLMLFATQVDAENALSDAPSYQWAGVVNIWDNAETQFTDVLFVYEDETVATDALTFWESAIDDITINQNVPLLEITDDYGAIFDGVTTEGRLLKLRFTSPVPSLDESFEFGDSGRVFTLFNGMFMRGDSFFFVASES